MANTSVSASSGGSHAARAAARSAMRETIELSQYLSFTLGSELFAMPIEFIREIIEFSGLTEVPMMPPFLRGVINLRGSVVPVVDLSVRFGREATQIGRRTCIVILEVGEDDTMQALGVIVDAVNEVLSIDPETIEPRPSFGARIRADFVTGIFRHAERFVIALDIRQVMSVEEMSAMVDIEGQDGDEAVG